MSDRNEIMRDTGFWVRLAYVSCGFLYRCEDKALRRYWIDDFLPEDITHTKHGAEISGIAWVGDGPRRQEEYRFLAVLPQKLLHRRGPFPFGQFVLDESRRTLEIELVHGNA